MRATARANAHRRLLHVLQEQREAEAAKHEEEEKERLVQLQHVLALKLSLDEQSKHTQAQAEQANNAREEAEQRRRAERRRLEAAGINAEGVFLERAERLRQKKERARIQREDEEESQRIEQRLQREEQLRLAKELREEERRRVKETLRMKVSRNVIETTAIALAQKEQRRILHQQQLLERRAEEEAEAKDGLLQLLPSASIPGEDDDDSGPRSPTTHERFLAWRAHQSGEAKEGELLYYQRRHHSSNLQQHLQQLHHKHHNHTRAPIMGRTYHNEPVIASPRALHFNDFHPSHPLTLSLTLTNTSFTFNSIQPLPSSHPSLVLRYHPPGRLSSGQSMTVHVTWKAAEEKEEEGVLGFVTESGRVEVGWKVTIKKAVVSVAGAELAAEVGVGERARDRIQLRNAGAIDVRWAIDVTAVEGQWKEDSDDGDEAKSSEPHAVAAFPAFPVHFLREGLLKGYSEEAVPVVFAPHVASTLTVRALLRLEAASEAPVTWGSASSFPLCIRLGSLPCPLHLLDSVLSLHTLVTGKLYRSTLTLHNRSSHSHRFLMHTPAALRDVVSFAPQAAFVEAGEQLDIAVRVRVHRADEERVLEAVTRMLASLKQPPGALTQPQDQPPQAELPHGQPSASLPEQEAAPAAAAEAPSQGEEAQVDKQGEGAMKAAVRAMAVPMSIEVVGQTLPIPWTLCARLTSSLLSLSLSHLSFPLTPLHTSSAIPLTLTNHSTLLQSVHLHLTPPLCSPTPLLTLFPLRSLTINLLFSPLAAVTYHGRATLTSKLGDDYTLTYDGKGVRGGGGRGGIRVEEGRVVRMAATADGDVERAWVTLVNDGDREETVEAWVPEVTKEAEGRVECGFLTALPRVLRLPPKAKRRVQLTFAPRVRQVEEERQRAAHEAAKAQPVAEEAAAADAKAADAGGKKKAKKLSKEEQAKAEEEARKAEEERLAREAEAAKARAEEERRREVERAYNSPEARAERERIDPPNTMLGEVRVEWEDGGEGGGGWSRHARHRLCFFVKGVGGEGGGRGGAKGGVEVVRAEVYTTVVEPALVVEGGREVDFGRVGVGEEGVRVVPVTNVSSVPHLLAVDPFPPSSPFTSPTPPTLLPPGSSAPFTFRFTPDPSAPTLSTSTLTAHIRSAHTRAPLILTASSFLPSFTVTLPPSSSPSPSPSCPSILHLGHALPSYPLTATITLTNTSPAALIITPLLAAPPSPTHPLPYPSPFTVTPPSLTLPPSSSFPLTLTFLTPDTGTFTSLLTLNASHPTLVTAHCHPFPLSFHAHPSPMSPSTLSLNPPTWSPLDRLLPSSADLFHDPPTLPSSSPVPAADKGKAAAPAKGKGGGPPAAPPAPVSLPVVRGRWECVGVGLWERGMREAGVGEVRFEGGEGVERVGWRVRGAVGVAEGGGGGSYEVMVVGGSMEGGAEEWFGVEGGVGAVRGGEEMRGEWVFQRARFEEWRRARGVEVEGRDVRGGEWVEAEGRCTFRVGGGGGKGGDGLAQVRVESFWLRAWVD